jgi:two-component system nitrate/nitrite response regulator NarL
MTGMSGLAVARALREVGSAVHIVFLTVNEDLAFVDDDDVGLGPEDQIQGVSAVARLSNDLDAGCLAEQGGTLMIESPPGGGTTILARLPLTGG